MFFKSFLIVVSIGIVSAKGNWLIELQIHTPKIDFILGTLINKYNYIIGQIKNPLLRLLGNHFSRRFVKQLAELRFASGEAIYHMEILDTVMNPNVINDAIINLEALFYKEFNLIKNIDSILAPFLNYLESVLCLLSDLNSDDVDGVGCKRGRKKYMKGL